MLTSAGLTWPTGRSRRSTVEAQFGSTRADLIHAALTTGDPLADAVVDEIGEHGRDVRIALGAGLEHGLGSLTDPPAAVAALLKDAEATPDYVDDTLLDEGSRPYFTKPAAVTAISLSAGALVRSYQSPSISTVLAITGRLVDGAPRRLYETAQWLTAAMLPGSLRVGEPGYVGTLQVRILHASMRRLARTRGYDEAALGAPINQVDLARTWMDFTLTSLSAEQLMGFDITPAEQNSFYRYWWYVGHLMGVAPELVEGITNNAEARRVDDLLQTVTGPLIPESAVLTEATIASLGARLHELVNVPERVAVSGLRSLTRRIHGAGLSRELSVPRTPLTDRVLSAAVPLVAARRARLRANPEAWDRAVRTNIEAARTRAANPDGRTGYQTHATE
ncbi:oxygenase MpaB family protein [Amycolatopsis rhabdoformis]|uniref:Oxygenase MpaB family protein n=1 Tax=Amycolatopsis rhabdoformis TaxID=1448059 RepID=A0ABZ1IFH3_9PSEU|nr:oxygenase MpaB family protein [Amycolatopsis rhabdoformis]WSE32453.1 oxygenase MpaB family protein [Amycolatopsis rhabdoformis]